MFINCMNLICNDIVMIIGDELNCLFLNIWSFSIWWFKIFKEIIRGNVELLCFCLVVSEIINFRSNYKLIMEKTQIDLKAHLELYEFLMGLQEETWLTIEKMES